MQLGKRIIDMNNNPMISVIMPVYNSEKYLKGTCQTILRQTYRDFELILVDDGSSDSSPSICDELSKEDSRVVVIHQQNKGICGARNRGLAAARGKYVTFCDNDDEMVISCLEKSVNAAEKTNSDCVRFRRRHELSTRFGKIGADYAPFKKFTIKPQKWEDYLLSIKKCGYGVWAGIYLRSFLNKYDINFDETVRYGYEDHIFVSRVNGNASKIVFVPDVLYIWKQRENGSTSCKSGKKAYENRWLGIFNWYKHEVEIMKRLNASSEQCALRKYEYIYCVLDELIANGCKSDEINDFLIRAKKDIGFAAVKKVKAASLSFKEKIKKSTIDHNCFWGYKLVRKFEKVLRVLRLC